ncbi:uncharacterized protein LOC135398986 [Ornithodoros turicata]|uniref:uncharacterized protein LOC135398986 n=1 Tax=Ornithodoros turicata TaxID=34597 RepID=UPI00313A14E3
MYPLKQNEIKRIARQISNQSLQLKSILDSLPQNRGSNRGFDEADDDYDTQIPATTNVSHCSRPPTSHKVIMQVSISENDSEDTPPYENDSEWSVWENEMQKLTNSLRMLLGQLQSVSEDTAQNKRGRAAENTYVNRVATRKQSGGYRNREQASLPPHPPDRRSKHDLADYFKRVAAQMDLLAEALKTQSFSDAPPTAATQAPGSYRTSGPALLAAPMGGMQHGVQPSQERMAQAIAAQTRAMQAQAIAVQAMASQGMHPGMVAGAPMMLPGMAAPGMMGQGMLGPCGGAGGLELARRSSSDAKGRIKPLYAGVNRLTDHMKCVSGLFKEALGIVPAETRLTVADQEEIRFCLDRLTKNMDNMTSDLRRTVLASTVSSAPFSKELMEGLKKKEREKAAEKSKKVYDESDSGKDSESEEARGTRGGKGGRRDDSEDDSDSGGAGGKRRR